MFRGRPQILGDWERRCWWHIDRAHLYPHRSEVFQLFTNRSVSWGNCLQEQLSAPMPLAYEFSFLQARSRTGLGRLSVYPHSVPHLLTRWQTCGGRGVAEPAQIFQSSYCLNSATRVG